MSQGRRVVPLRPGCSDGDALHVPKQGQYTQVVPPTLYLEKVGQQWMTNRGEAQAGAKYILEALPSGYTLWERPRPSAPKHVDKYLYGHPGGKYFNSPNRFYPHFEHLMKNNGSNIGCPCTVCAGTMGVLPKGSSSSARAHTSSTASSQPSTVREPTPVSPPAPASVSSFPRPPTAPAVRAPVQVARFKGRPKLVSAGVDSSRVDEEGTPDVYRNLVDKLKRHTMIDEMIHEPLSPDWRAEEELLPVILQGLKQQGQWIPRVGDIVLYIRDLPTNVDVMRHEVTDEFQLYDEEAEEFLGSPPWEAGLVGEAPADPSTIADLHRSESETNVIYSGVRVEPLPDPNSHDKSLSKRHKYVSLRQTRPFILWKELLHNVPRDQWHPTIINALTAASTLSLVGKYRFKGNWPHASIFCHGIYIGSEMLAVGDTVRLSPSTLKKHTTCLEVLVIKSIRLKWSDLDKASNNDYDEGRPYNSSVWIYGSGYTSDTSLVNKEYLSEDNTEPPKATVEYGEWYPLHSTDKELAVPCSRIMGRLYEREAMAFWLNSEPGDQPSLDNGREALVEARSFARHHDERIAREPDATWFWGDSRADALNLHTINGLEIAKYDQERDVRDMRKKIKVIEGMENSKPAPGKSSAPVSLGSRGLRSFMAPGIADQADQAAPGSSANTSVAGSSSASANSGASKKRPHIIKLSDDEDEIRKQTRVVDNGPSVGKKAKVAVVIR
ncbi:hypothetical protein CC86DRAFT_304549 [Ophiobolus disseminans]|uniref:Cryptic loci regulator 2 N-terminal domain-containing protein n=1 Tax=Ophiobolus disseminans TaxID=1469910 RepID=A0A6A6ZJZ8_9PLEO|nr:hypothetical protein CC86DRAFT_304549 [Ophiobolus disseminans]